MQAVRILERIKRHAPLGLRFWDVAAGTDAIDGLSVTVGFRDFPDSFVRASVNRHGIYSVFGLPALREFELNGGDDAMAWMAALRRYRVEVQDPEGRFLPISFDADLPARGIFTWRTPWTSPPQPFSLPIERQSPPAPMLEHVPLFSSPSREVPGPLATVRAQLREIGSGRPAAWCLLKARVGTSVCGMGLADAEGRIALLFPYPDAPRPLLGVSPPAANVFHWDVELGAYYARLAPNSAVPRIPDLADVLAQLSSRQTLFQSTASPATALPALLLEYRVPLTVRTEMTASGPSSFLFVNAA